MKTAFPIQIIDRNSRLYPDCLSKRLGKEAPEQLWAIGNIQLLNIAKTALFCSKKCPGDAILNAMKKAQEWRDQKRCVVSGFHSPVEKECLKILLRGNQPIIICPARGIVKMRIPKEWTEGIESGRILILSPFDPARHRVTTKQSEVRNVFVAALADEVYLAHTSEGGKIKKLEMVIAEWGM